MWEFFKRGSIESADIVLETTVSTTLVESSTIVKVVDVTSIETEKIDKQRSIVKYTSSTSSSSSTVDDTGYIFGGLILLGFIGCIFMMCLKICGCNSEADAVGNAAAECCVAGCIGLCLSRDRSPVN